MSGKRPGQVRFEAWVPVDLYRAFQQQHPGRGRKAWLAAAMRAEVERRDEDEALHRLRLLGKRWPRLLAQALSDEVQP